MITSRDSFTNARAMAFIVTLLAALACGQVSGVNVVWNNAFGDLDYNNGGNWEGGWLPEAGIGDEASISNGDAVFLDSNPAVYPAGLVVQAGSSFEIQNGGSLDVVAVPPTLAGNITVGVDGTLIVQSGGTLIAAGQPNL